MQDRLLPGVCVSARARCTSQSDGSSARASHLDMYKAKNSEAKSVVLCDEMVVGSNHRDDGWMEGVSESSLDGENKSYASTRTRRRTGVLPGDLR